MRSIASSSIVRSVGPLLTTGAGGRTEPPPVPERGSQANASRGVHPRPASARSLDGGGYSTLSGIFAALINGRASWLRS